MTSRIAGGGGSVVSETTLSGTSRGTGRSGSKRVIGGRKAAIDDNASSFSNTLKGASSRDADESEDLLSDYSSETSFFDEERAATVTSHHNLLPSGDVWTYSCYKTDGKIMIFGEWLAKTKAYRMVVIGPDWPCVLLTYVVIAIPSIMAYLYLVHSQAEQIVFFIIFGLCIFGLTTVFISDPGLVRKYHHARSRHWTYCDHCESFRPPGTVHCSACQVCVAGYDHHCPWTGKCIGHGNYVFFKLFIVSLVWLGMLVFVLGILQLCNVE